jgi:hypothetical protein
LEGSKILVIYLYAVYKNLICYNRIAVQFSPVMHHADLSFIMISKWLGYR